ncbi:MAG TPA: peptidoglycan DD-metalloendopeptidase family protein [Nevskiaceae bacterium]|nr:peptidoglycan DD-metalloendopeptidase family protein [Nevskiaceae bacterium]
MNIVKGMVGWLCVLMVAVPLAAADPPPASAAEGEAQLQRVQTRIAALQRRLEKDRGQLEPLQKALEDAERTLGETEARRRELEGQVEALGSASRQTREQREQVEAEVSERRRVLAAQLRAAYQIGARPQAQILLSQEPGDPVSRVLAYHRYFSEAQAAQLRAIAERQSQLQTLDQTLARTLAELESSRERQRQVLAAQQKARAERARALEQLAARIEDAEVEIKTLERQEKDLETLVASLREVLADLPMKAAPAAPRPSTPAVLKAAIAEQGSRPFAELKGRLLWPAEGDLLARFGETKPEARRSWNGLWIAAPTGAPIRAAARGRVVHVGRLHRYGLLVILEHEGGYYSLYGHTEQALRKPGETLQPGEALATAGDSGGHARSGVYFELRKGTTPLDPQAWLRSDPVN